MKIPEFVPYETIDAAWDAWKTLLHGKVLARGALLEFIIDDRTVDYVNVSRLADVGDFMRMVAWYMRNMSFHDGLALMMGVKAIESEDLDVRHIVPALEWCASRILVPKKLDERYRKKFRSE